MYKKGAWIELLFNYICNLCLGKKKMRLGGLVDIFTNWAYILGLELHFSLFLNTKSMCVIGL